MAITQFLVGWRDGTFRTIAEPRISSVKSAAKLFAVRYGLGKGERFKIKIRSSNDEWVYYVRTLDGIRQVAGW